MPLAVFLDDDQVVLQGLVRSAEIYLPGWEIKSFSRPEEFHRFLKGDDEFLLLVTDFHMPPSKSNGAHVATWVRALTDHYKVRPTVVLCSSDISGKEKLIGTDNQPLFDNYVSKIGGFAANLKTIFGAAIMRAKTATPSGAAPDGPLQ